MKILQINASYKPAYIYGGPTMSVSKLSEQLASAGHQVAVFTTTANGVTELPVEPNKVVIVNGVAVTYFSRLSKDHSHFSPILLYRLWKEIRTFDIVHISAWWNLVSVFSCWIALARGLPVIVSPRGTLSSYSFSNNKSLLKKMLHKLLGNRLLERSWIHVTSEQEKERIKFIVNPKQIFNIPNFVVISSILPKKSLADNQTIKLIFFSRIEKKKGLELLIKALPLLTIPYHLTIAGNGDNEYIESLKQIAAKDTPAQNVSWLGFHGSSKFELLSDHDLMVLPSYDENFGNVVIESLSVGTAVLISNKVGLADYVLEKGLGWVCEPNEVELSRNINSIWQQRPKLLSINREAPGQIREDFNEFRLTEKYIDMYNKTINNG